MLESFAERYDSLYSFVYSDYEKWLVVPILMLLLALGVIGYSYATTGEMVSKGIDFTGGTEIRVQVAGEVTQQEMEQAFAPHYADVNVRTLGGDGTRWMLVETKSSLENGEGSAIGTAQSETDVSLNASEQVASILKGANIPYEGEINIQTMGSAVSESFLFEAQIAVVIAFIIMSTAIFVAFRNFVPSMAVILAAFTDIVVAVAGMNLLGINLTLGSLAALLMLIGYSVDTDIVLSTRVLKQRQGDLKERIKDSIATGVTMSAGAITSFIVLSIVSTSPVLDQIAAVIIIGLLADIPITWLGNTVILKMHVEGRI